MIKDFANSLKSYIRALKLIRELKLYKYFFIPAIMGFIIFSLIVFSIYSFSDELGELLSNLYPWEWGKNFMHKISMIIGGITILIFGLLIFKHVLMALCGPLMSPVSEIVEEHLTGEPVPKSGSKKESFSKLLRSVRLNVRNLLIEIGVTIPLTLLSLIPVFGLIATVLIFYIQSYYTGYGNMDYTLERYLNYKESKLFVRKNRGLAAGNGLIFTLLVLIPFVGAMFTLPIATVASTIDTVKKLHPNIVLPKA